MKVTNAERKLIEDLEAFSKEAVDISSNAVNGILIAATVLNATHDQTLAKIVTSLNRFCAIIFSLELGIDEGENENLWIKWEDCSSGCTCYYRDGRDNPDIKPLTEMTLIYSLMLFKQALCDKLSVIDNVMSDSSICLQIKGNLHKIIKDYVESKITKGDIIND